jgi:protease I
MRPWWRVREKRVYHLVMHEIPPGWDVTKESPSYHLASHIAFRDVKPEEYAGLFLSGGRAPEYLRYDEELLRITRHFFAEE